MSSGNNHNSQSSRNRLGQPALESILRLPPLVRDRGAGSSDEHHPAVGVPQNGNQPTIISGHPTVSHTTSLLPPVNQISVSHNAFQGLEHHTQQDGGNDEDEDMPELVSESEGDPDEVAHGLVDDDSDDSEWIDQNGYIPPLTDAMRLDPIPRPNRRARVEEDQDDERDRRHPSQRMADTSIRGQSGESPQPSTIPSPRPPHVHRSLGETGTDPMRGLFERIFSSQSTTNPTSNTNASRPLPGTRVTEQVFTSAFTMDPHGNLVPLDPPGSGPGGTGGPPLQVGGIDIQAFLQQALDRFAAAGGLAGFDIGPERENPERAKKLVNGLQVVSPGLVKRMGRVGGAPGAHIDSTIDGVDIPGCAVCWDSLISDESSPNGENTAPYDSLKDGSQDSDEGKIVALPCAHVFHASCLIPWFSRPRQTTCPTCRFNIDPDNLTYTRPSPSRPAEQPGNDDSNQAAAYNTHEPIPSNGNNDESNSATETPAPNSGSRGPAPTDIPGPGGFITLDLNLVFGPPPPNANETENPQGMPEILNPFLDDDEDDDEEDGFGNLFASMHHHSHDDTAQAAPGPHVQWDNGSDAELTRTLASMPRHMHHQNHGPSATTQGVPRSQQQPQQPSLDNNNTSSSENNTTRATSGREQPPLTALPFPFNQFLTNHQGGARAALRSAMPFPGGPMGFGSGAAGTAFSGLNPLNFAFEAFPPPPSASAAQHHHQQPAPPLGGQPAPRTRTQSMPNVNTNPGSRNINAGARTPPTVPPPPFMAAFGPGTRAESETGTGTERYGFSMPFMFSGMGVNGGSLPSGMFGGSARPGSQQQAPGQRREWAPPPASGPTLRERVERKEREAGLRCAGPSCGLAPTDDDPLFDMREGVKQMVSIRSGISGDVLGDPICNHKFHASCLVTAERVASLGANKNKEEGHAMKVSCPVCRSTGAITCGEWAIGERTCA